MKNSRGISRALIAGVLIIVVIVASIGIYAVATYPRTILSSTVSFTAGFDFKREEFDVPFLHSWAQLKIDVVSGTTLWLARIQSGNTTVLNYGAGHMGQFTYTSDWIQVDSGRYNLTMVAVGFGSLEANVKVTSKGGFW
jgi:hypothetical protein